MKYTTKAQMEMMGLAVIVILLALGIFFITRFTLSGGQQTTTVQVAGSKQVITSFVSTLLASNANCQGSSATFTKVIEEIPNQQFSTLQCGTGTLRDYFESTVKDILAQTLDIYNYKYELSVTFPTTTGESPIIINHNCLATSQVETVSYPIPADVGLIRVVMKICY